ncbi:ATP-dependent DNA helicase, component of RuvABC resolvasome [Desulfosarcina cetonica]|uniref:Holliday junction branch migration DNA helicase RuvB n=1 Tax=Desulfosarcina cetonica TaxID=90730 RepID=UPI0006D0D99E|nr:Holliday junction branch migration DNA helicase RuvB [Desulfosarcina cetonica]VTR66146.1 ATP-dependent DNA helicase, component of RuvABC resolvasome [Desulfosarcina cetonica]
MSDPILTHRSTDMAIVSGALQPTDRDPDLLSLRPERLDDYVGQAEVVETLKIAIEAAQLRSEPLEHVLFHGPPGLGKTTLAHIIANEMGGTLTVTSGPALEKGGDLIGILTHLGEADVLFVDEIHRTPKTVEEFLYPAMEDFAVDFVFDKGIHARSHRYRLKRFTLVGATTRVGLLSAPLRDRFGIFRNLDFYGIDDLVHITMRSAALLDVRIDKPGAEELAKRSRGTPRIVNRLLKRVRDYTQVRADGTITQETVEAALALEGVDAQGLTQLDRRYLKTIIDFYGGGPVGIEAISATLQEESDTLVDVVEPYLLKIGMVIRTSSGRRVSDIACRHLGVPVQQKLF